MALEVLLAVGLMIGPAAELERDLRPEPVPRVAYRDSTPLGTPSSGGLQDGTLLPREGRDFFTWDPVRHRTPNRAWRRWGTDDAVRVTLRILREFRRDHPRAPRVGIGDLSRREGGSFDDDVSPGYSHASHQNGLDVDVYYPVRSGRERGPRRVEQVDVRLAQELVDRFVEAGAQLVLVGPQLPLTGPPSVVVSEEDHNDHLHARFAP